MADGSASRDLSRLVPWALAIAACVSAVSAIAPYPVGVFQDDGIYTILARSLATGEGYRYLHIPGAPNATHYPPGYPLFLAMLWKVYPSFPENVTLFKFANAGLLGVAAVLFYRLARERVRLSPLAAALGVGAFTACAPVILLTVMVLSEPLFLALLAPALLLAERAAASGRVRDVVLAAALVVVLSMVRTLGVLAIPALGVVLVWRREWRGVLALGMTAFVLLLPWQLWVSMHAGEVPPVLLGKYGSYAGWLGDAIARDGVGFVRGVAWENLGSLVKQGWASTATEAFPAWVRYPVTVALVALFGVGFAALMRRASVVAWFLVMYLAVVVIWPFGPARFTWAVWPLVGVVYALAVARVWGWGREEGERADTSDHGMEGAVARETASQGAPPNNNIPPDRSAPITLPSPATSFHRLRAPIRAVALGAVAAIATGYVAHNVSGVRHDWWGRVQAATADRARPLAEWVSANTDSSAVIATDDDPLIHLYTGRRTVPNGTFTPQEHLVPQTPAFAVEALREIIATYPVDFVLASTEYGTYAARGLVEATPPELRIVGALTTGGVFATPPRTVAP